MNYVRSFSSWSVVVVLASLGAQGCSSSSTKPATTCPARSAVAYAEFKPSGMPPATTCPSVGTTFKGTKEGRLLVATPLKIYCRYDQDNGPFDLDGLRKDLGQVKNANWNVSLDCPVLAPTAPRAIAPIDPMVLTPFENAYVGQAGVMRYAGRVVSPPVAIMDSASPTNAYNYTTVLDNFGHGRAVGRVVADFACPLDPTKCDAIKNYLALPLMPALPAPPPPPPWPAATPPPTPEVPPKADPINGGFFGSRGDLADQLRQAVTDLAGVDAMGVAKPFIVNLSLGWDKNIADVLPNCDDCSDAVRLALIRAWCAGGLVIAAAGNGPQGSGPLLPAAWESLAISESDCIANKFDFHRSTGKAKPVYDPLVHAVSAVDVADRPLPTNRLSSQPRLVAYGMDVVTSDMRPPNHTQPFTGTSMATAIVTGVAALVWGTQPSLAPVEVMDAVYAAGLTLPGTVDVCIGGAPCSQSIKRISGCATLMARNVVTGCVPSPGLMLPGPNRAMAVASDGGAPDADAPDGGTPDADAPDTAPPVDAPTPTNPIYRATDQPWVVPQPGPVGCDVCRLHTNKVLDGNLGSSLYPYSTLVQVEVGGSWSDYATVTSSSFSIAMSVAGAPSGSAIVKFTAFVGYWVELPEESVPVVP
jgi:Subtilase family